MVLFRVYITSSGLRSAELPFAQGSVGGGSVEKILLKASAEEGGGKVWVMDIGRCREKKLEMLRSALLRRQLVEGNLRGRNEGCCTTLAQTLNTRHAGQFGEVLFRLRCG